MANYGDLGFMSRVSRFQDRVNLAMCTAAAAVYSETATANTSAGTSTGSHVLTFSAVPSWVGVGGTISNLTHPTTLTGDTTIIAVTATTVTLSGSASGSIGSGDTISFLQHLPRKTLATNVSSGNYKVEAACAIVLSNATIAAEATLSTQPDFGIPDTDIQFAVNSAWNMMAGA